MEDKNIKLNGESALLRGPRKGLHRGSTSRQATEAAGLDVYPPGLHCNVPPVIPIPLTL